MVRFILAGVLGGIALFMWGFVFHMLVPVSKAGVKMLPNEPAVLTALKENIPEPGVYIAPGMLNMESATDAEKAEWTAKYEKGPTAFMVYSPSGRPMAFGRWLGIEFGSNVLGAFIVSFIFLLTGATTFMGRVTIATLIGLSGWVAINISYWNWYRFPKEFVLVEGFDQVVGWLIAGIVIAIIMKPRPV